MHSQKRLPFSLLSLMLTMMVATASLVSCGDFRDTYPVVIENHTSEVLYIYEGGLLLFEIEAGKERTIPLIRRPKFQITAKDAQGETVFSQKFGLEQIQRPVGSPFRIIIPPINESISDNSTIAD